MTPAQLESERRELLAKAEAAYKDKVVNDPARPVFHFHAPSQWMNDPNGPIYYRGWYHVFYQFNPYGDQWEHMHWGHARSRDMVKWEDLPVALWPTKSLGEDHIFSGSTFLNGAGKPTIFYTSISGKRPPEQWAATPLDGNLLEWQKSPANPVVSAATQAPTQIDEWRDPFLFKKDGQTYMVTGGAHDGHGIVALYKAQNSDLTKWHFEGFLFQHPEAGNLECPNIAKIGDHWVLLVSLRGYVEAFVGTLGDDMRFKAQKRSILAEGSYASQLLTDKSGRCVHLAWMNMNHHHGWNGCLTLPSELSVAADGTLLRKPIRALTKLRDKDLSVSNLKLSNTFDLTDRVGGDQLELIAEIDPGTATAVRFQLPHGCTVSYDCRTRRLSVPGRPPAELPAGRFRLHVFFDHSIVDVYANDGAVTQCASVPTDAAVGTTKVVVEGGEATIQSLKAYTLGK